MEIQGKVIAVLPERSGVSARGEWKSQTYVIETQEQYPKKMAFDVFGADRAWNVTKVSQQAMASSANAAGVANPTNQQNLFPPEQQSAQQQAQQRGNSDDLPF